MENISKTVLDHLLEISDVSLVITCERMILSINCSVQETLSHSENERNPSS